MKYGICTASLSKKNLSFLKDIGFDYIEVNFKKIAALSEENFAIVLNDVKAVSLPVLTANSMLPSMYKIASSGFAIATTYDFLNKGFARAAQLGVQKVVFGSGGARSTPKGVDQKEGYQRVVNFLNEAAKITKKYNINIVIEPLSPFECNLINTVAQSAKLAANCDADNVFALSDFFHMKHSRDKIDNIYEISGKIAHSHISNPTTRMFPKHAKEADYRAYLDALSNAGCDTCSVEGWAIFFKSAAQKAINLLKSTK